MQQPRIGATEFALTRIEQVRANRRQPDAGVRVAITGRADGQFVYDLQLVTPGKEQAGDMVVEGPEGIPFHVPLTTAAYLDGATLDADPSTGALTVSNPNPLWLEPLAQDVQRLIDLEINPAVAQHGGHIDLLDVSEGVAYVHMGGGCQGCGMASVTLAQGVRTAILDRFPEITDVRDTTDHAQGANPYYQASKK
ncbi:MAG: Fe/S biosis protein NfuA [Chloroflexota bacterium]|jgi:Fe/S biogenesis protein NfuA|nr:Fe/S biosis protein NfuA [Chloroflexota bacterium]